MKDLKCCSATPRRRESASLRAATFVRPHHEGGHTEVRRVDTCQLVPWCGKTKRGGGRTRNEVVFMTRTAAVSSARYQFFMIDLVREQQQSTLDDRSADVRGTNKSKNKGLISADRRTKPTLMLTIPRSEQSRLQWIYLFQRLKLR